MVRVEVVSPDHDQPPQIVIGHQDREWNAIEEGLPAGVTQAQAVEYHGGRAVSVRREDGLTVAIDADGVFGNNAAPGSPAVTDLPGLDKLLELAASESLTLPGE